ncbi:hypothetical protein BDF20DRAFT_833453 [Mycotypha africana]|uniref:uncharacterized protein n=1 Tax=Mycotypha africana TaxID=64632 RepID=UPI002300F3EA|nr:uncharacterized protein BDF20DRAFT_833453 [Mycotypha africana]KAI8988621.1 hypothetical protein BDF20DRAFT_833453 [Mycotypha africana]
MCYNILIKHNIRSFVFKFSTRQAIKGSPKVVLSHAISGEDYMPAFSGGDKQFTPQALTTKVAHLALSILTEKSQLYSHFVRKSSEKTVGTPSLFLFLSFTFCLLRVFSSILLLELARADPMC